MKLIKYFLIATLPLFCMSCDREYDQMGLPKKITFGKEGGEQTFDMSYNPTNVEIFENSDCKAYSIPQPEQPEIEMSAQYGWLTVKCRYDKKYITIKAEPYEGNKKRKFEVDVYSGNKFATIKVYQDEK